MSVLIRGAEMPVSCVECPCAYYTEGMHHDCCQATPEDNDIKAYEESRPDWCPLVPVPPHGRLGDLDKLADNMRSATAGMEHRAIIMHEICRAPTIIPAEEAKA